MLQDQTKVYIDSYLHKFVGELSLSGMLIEFSLKFVYSTMCWKKFQIFGVHILGKYIEYNLDIFTYVSLSHSKLTSKFLSSHPREREIAHSHRQHFLKYLFPPIAEMTGISYVLLYQNLIRKYEYGLEHQVSYILICNFFKCGGFKVF